VQEGPESGKSRVVNTLLGNHRPIGGGAAKSPPSPCGPLAGQCQPNLKPRRATLNPNQTKQHDQNWTLLTTPAAAGAQVGFAQQHITTTAATNRPNAPAIRSASCNTTAANTTTTRPSIAAAAAATAAAAAAFTVLLPPRYAAHPVSSAAVET